MEKPTSHPFNPVRVWFMMRLFLAGLIVLAGHLGMGTGMAMNPPGSGTPPANPPFSSSNTPGSVPTPAPVPVTPASDAVVATAPAAAPTTGQMAPPKLAQVMNDQLRALSASGNDECWNQADLVTGVLRYNPHFWLRNVTNIFASYVACYDPASGAYQNFAQLHPISPHFCITAHHTHNPANRLCLLPDGSVYTNYFIAWTNFSDLEVDLMAKPNPSWYRVMPNDAPYVSGHDPETMLCVRQHASMHGVDGYSTTFLTLAACDNFGCWAFSQSDGLGGWIWTTGPSFTFGDYSRGDTWIEGDSSSAAWVILNNEAVLMGCAYGAQICPFLDVNRLNALMAGLAAAHGLPPEQATAYPLQSFPKIKP